MKLIGVYLALIVLLGLALGSAYVHLGDFSLAVSLIIAATKTSFIAWAFMELKDSRAVTRLFASIGCCWLGILLALTLADYMSRNWTELPSHWPQEELGRDVP